MKKTTIEAHRRRLQLIMDKDVGDQLSRNRYLKWICMFVLCKEIEKEDGD